MANSANTFTSLQPMMKEKYPEDKKPKKKRFSKIAKLLAKSTKEK